MTWTTVYLVCFLLGFSLSAVSWLLGALHLHLPHVGHGHGGGAPAHSGHGGHSARAGHGASVHGGSPSLQLRDADGVSGVVRRRRVLAHAVCRRLARLPPSSLAIIVGGAGASAVFWFMAKVLWAPDENLDRDDYEMVGLLGVISSPIRAGGTGEVLFSQAGHDAAARAANEPGNRQGASRWSSRGIRTGSFTSARGRILRRTNGPHRRLWVWADRRWCHGGADGAHRDFSHSPGHVVSEGGSARALVVMRLPRHPRGEGPRHGDHPDDRSVPPVVAGAHVVRRGAGAGPVHEAGRRRDRGSGGADQGEVGSDLDSDGVGAVPDQVARSA